MKSIKLYLSLAMLTFVGMAFAAPSPVSHSYAAPIEDVIPQVDTLKMLDVDMLWDHANTKYANGDYTGAGEAYNEILARDVHSAALYYNIGNVHYKRDEVALALLNYYKALRLSPSDVDILHNIEVAKARTTDNIESMPRLFLVEWGEWVGARLSSMSWSILSLLLFALTAALLLLYLLAESFKMRRAGFLSFVIFGVLFLVSTRYALIGRAEIMDSSEAIVMSQSMSVKSSPNRASTELFILHAGTKVDILTTHDTWCEIVIEDGKRGWVESSRIEKI